MVHHEDASAEGSVYAIREPRSRPVRRGRQRRRWWLAGSAALVVLVVLGLSLFGGHIARPLQAAKAESNENDAPILDGDVIRFSDAFAKRAGITAERVAIAKLSPFVTVVGTLTYDPHRFASVGARIHGRVRRVAKYLGDSVQRGDVLVEIESAELGRAEAQVLATRAKEKAAAAEAKRERYLADAKVTSERDAELAQAGYEAAHAERGAAERALEALGGDLRMHSGVLQLHSPISGHVVDSEATIGRTVEPTETLYDVAELSSLWVQLSVFERELGGIHVGNAVEVSWPGAEHVIEGEVDHVGEIIDLDTRTAPVRVVVSNPEGALRPGQSVTARIHVDQSATGTLTIPRAALSRIDGKPTVFVLHDANTVEPRTVTIGSEDADRVAVREGLQEGARVVTTGMFALKSELFR
jgi:cobalt-zinc-cadmium efflux system membrane fusion protein